MTLDKTKLQKLLWAEAASFRADCADWKRNTEALQEFLGEKTLEEVALELLAENEALRKELGNWQEVVDAVKRETAERFTRTSHGNAPGHCHSTSGVWDGDNGALAGKECAWCKTWNAAMGQGERQ